MHTYAWVEQRGQLLIFNRTAWYLLDINLKNVGYRRIVPLHAVQNHKTLPLRVKHVREVIEAVQWFHFIFVIVRMSAKQ